MINKDNPHITSEQLHQFNQNSLKDDLFMETLEHLATCEYCAGLYADSLSQNMMVNPSIDFKEKTLNKIIRYEQKSLRFSRINFFTYRLRVGFTMLGIILLIISYNFISIPTITYTEYTPPSYEEYLENSSTSWEEELDRFTFLDEINLKLVAFSKKIILTEVQENEKTKK